MTWQWVVLILGLATDFSLVLVGAWAFVKPKGESS